MSKKLKGWKGYIIALFLITIAITSKADIALAKGAILKSDHIEQAGEGEIVTGKIRVTGDVYPYLKITIVDPNITWDINGGTGEAASAGPLVMVKANSLFNIGVGDVDNLINTAYPPDYNTGANILETWFATGDNEIDNPFEEILPPNKAIIAGSNDPTNPNHGDLEWNIAPTYISYVSKYLWNKIRVEGNDEAGHYLDPDGYIIIIYGHI
ncbi:MAG: hypothetical protein AB1422_14950 [bacterium]